MPLDKKTLLDAVKEAKTKSGEKKFTQSIELILVTTAMVLMPKGPSAGPNGGPAVACPPLTSKSTIFFSTIILHHFMFLLFQPA